MRSFDMRVPIAFQVAITQIIAKYDHNVGSFVSVATKKRAKAK